MVAVTWWRRALVLWARSCCCFWCRESWARASSSSRVLSSSAALVRSSSVFLLELFALTDRTFSASDEGGCEDRKRRVSSRSRAL